jgi:hypothetical protein
LSKHAAYVPKHRGVPERPLVEAPKKALKKTLVLSAIAVAGTGTTVAGGVALNGSPSVATAADVAAPVANSTPVETSKAASSAPPATSAVRRSPVLSRSDNRDAVDPAKKAALASAGGTAARAVVQTEDMAASGDPKAIASALLGSFGWSGSQFGCLVNLWNRESGWNTHADNPSSSAYGIPQALPGSKMASAGPDWQNNAETQIKWGLGYIRDRYGSPCGAWGHSQANGWY